MEPWLLERWLKEGVINEATAARMKADVKKSRGGAGGGLLLLAALLNGVVLFVFTQLHGVDVGVHEILLLWLVCLLPLAYGVRARALAAASSFLFVVWFVAVAFRGLSLFATFDRWMLVSPLLLLGGVTAFALGGLHYLVPGFETVARPSRLVGLQCALLGLFTMTLDVVAGAGSFFDQLRDPAATEQVAVAAVCAAIVTVAATIAGQALRARMPRLTRVEAPVNVVLVATALSFMLAPLPSDIASKLASGVLLVLVVSVFVVGAKDRDRRLLRISLGSLTLFLALHLGDLLSGATSLAVAIGVAVAFVVVGAAATVFFTARIKKPPAST
jgi:uncharacterized membrane protein